MVMSSLKSLGLRMNTQSYAAIFNPLIFLLIFLFSVLVSASKNRSVVTFEICAYVRFE